jgi:hypothetical protein
MKEYLNKLPGPEELLKKHRGARNIPEVNGHLHTPYSFGAFKSIGQMFSMAENEKIVSLGINDFYTADGYEEFEEKAMETRILPLFNIEFMGLIKELQDQDIRVNDPNNPGRVYFSGKGLKNPLSVSGRNREFISNLQENSQVQVREMCAKTESLLRDIQAPFSITYEDVKAQYAKNLVRERHIARAIREATYEHFVSVSERLDFYERLFGGKEINASFNNLAAVENEIRSMILKSGGPAFVPEDSNVFPPLERIIDFILDAGGIPCYPVLLDDRSGNITAFEGDWNGMDRYLKKLGVSMLELIPIRNSLEKLEEFVSFFRQRNYIISFGTEHNTPAHFPLTVTVEGDMDLTPELKEISYLGTCVIAAHQYLVARGEEGFILSDGRSDTAKTEFYQDLGHAVIMEFTQPHSLS